MVCTGDDGDAATTLRYSSDARPCKRPPGVVSGPRSSCMAAACNDGPSRCTNAANRVGRHRANNTATMPTSAARTTSGRGAEPSPLCVATSKDA